MESATPTSRPVAQLLDIPWNIFRTISDAYGGRVEDEKKFMVGIHTACRVRPLHNFGPYCRGKPYETVAGAITISRTRDVTTNGWIVTLLSRMPLHEDELGPSHVNPAPVLLTLKAEATLKRDRGVEGREYRIATSAVFGHQFQFGDHAQYWPATLLMLDMFATQSQGFTSFYREDGRAAA